MSDRPGHPGEPSREDDAFAERVGRMLRPPERFDDDFERSLVSAIRADRPIEHAADRSAGPAITAPNRALTPAWWRSPVLQLSPLAGLALAASLIAMASLGTWRVAARQPRPAGSVAATPALAATAHDTVTFVRFVFLGQATSVALVGDFNEWGAQPVQLTATGTNGAWTVSVPVSNGRHEYAFVVDGKRWVADPLSSESTDEFNTTSSVITVGT